MKFALTLFIAACAAQAAFGADSAAPAAASAAARPTEASVRELFAVMHSESLVGSYMTQIEGTIRASMQQAAAGQKPSAQQQQMLDDLGTRIMDLVKGELTWAKVEPTMLEVYRNTFTQHEVDGMLKFYRSDIGRAVVNKLPTATAQSMQGIQDRMKDLTPKILQLEKDTAAQMKSADGTAAQPPPPPPPKP